MIIIKTALLLSLLSSPALAAVQPAFAPAPTGSGTWVEQPVTVSGHFSTQHAGITAWTGNLNQYTASDSGSYGFGSKGYSISTGHWTIKWLWTGSSAPSTSYTLQYQLNAKAVGTGNVSSKCNDGTTIVTGSSCITGHTYSVTVSTAHDSTGYSITYTTVDALSQTSQNSNLSSWGGQDTVSFIATTSPVSIAGN